MIEKESLPSLGDFDYIYRMLKNFTDHLIELDEDKSFAFINFIWKDQTLTQNAFIKYLISCINKKINT